MTELMLRGPQVGRRAGRSVLWGALWVWLGSRLAVAILTLTGAHATADGQLGAVPDFLKLWDRWDVGLFVKIAHFGYFRTGINYHDCCTEAFFPGDPLVLRFAHIFLPNWIGAGLVVSLVAGGFAAVALARLAVLETGDQVAGSRAVLFLVLSPYAVFLFAGYSESLFLAFAVTGWLAARRGRWWLAGLLVAYAASVRITGLFLAVALVVEYVVARRRSGQPILATPAVALLLPLLSLGSYVVYLHQHTHDWLAWQHAQKLGWGRMLTSPWKAFQTSWHAAFDAGSRSDFALSFLADTAAIGLGLLLVAVLVKRARWSEAVYVGLGVIALGTSTFYESVARSALLWFPAWLLLAQSSLRRRWVLPAWCWTAAPLMAVLTIAFTRGNWVD